MPVVNILDAKVNTKKVCELLNILAKLGGINTQYYG